jgi:hypothetical protein
MPTRTLIKQKSISGFEVDSPSIVPIVECVGASVAGVNHEKYHHSASGKHCATDVSTFRTKKKAAGQERGQTLRWRRPMCSIREQQGQVGGGPRMSTPEAIIYQIWKPVTDGA